MTTPAGQVGLNCPSIDWASFAADIQRRAGSIDRSIRWIGKHLCISSPTMHRAATGKPVEAATYLTICRWLGYSPYLYWRDK